MLARKIELQAGKPTTQSATMERSRLNQARTLALRRQDKVELDTIDQQLAELPAVTTAREEDVSDMLAKVNERNRKANLEAVRKSEIQEAERKRRDRKLQAAARASGTSTPVDPSARLKTIPKLFNAISRFVPVHFPWFISLLSLVHLFSPHSSHCAGQEHRSRMGALRCFSPKNRGSRRDQYLHYHHRRCQAMWDHRTNPRLSRPASSTRLKSTSEISDSSLISVRAVTSLHAMYILLCTSNLRMRLDGGARCLLWNALELSNIPMCT